MLHNSHANSRRSSLSALCLTAALGLGHDSTAQGPAPTMDPKVPPPAKIEKGYPDLLAQELKVRLRTSDAHLPADERIRLPGSAELFKVGARINDKADPVKNPEETIANSLQVKRDFEIPVILPQAEQGRYYSWYEKFGDQKDAGYAIASLVSPSLVVLASKSAYVGPRLKHGDNPMTVLTSQLEVVNTADCSAFGIRIYDVKQHRYVGADGGNGPFSKMEGGTLSVVLRSFSQDSTEGEVCALTAHMVGSRLYGSYYPEGVSPEKSKGQIAETSGRLVVYFLSKSDGTIQAFGNWALAKAALPERLARFIDEDLDGLVDTSTTKYFFEASRLPSTRMIPDNSEDPVTKKPMSPVNRNLLNLEGAAFAITTAHTSLPPALTLGTFSPAFSADAVRLIQKDAANPKKNVTPWIAASGQPAKHIQDLRIGDLVPQHDKSGFATKAMGCGARGFLPVLNTKPTASGILIDAISTAFDARVGDPSDLSTLWMQQLLGILGTNPSQAKKPGVKVEHIAKSDAPPSSNKTGMAKANK